MVLSRQHMDLVKDCISSLDEGFRHANGEQFNGFSLRGGKCAVHISHYYDDVIFIVHGDWVTCLSV